MEKHTSTDNRVLTAQIALRLKKEDLSKYQKKANQLGVDISRLTRFALRQVENIDPARLTKIQILQLTFNVMCAVLQSHITLNELPRIPR